MQSSDPNPFGWPIRQPANPLRARAGALKFDYGAQTLFAASSADEADGRQIVIWLAPKLPRTATEQ